MSSERRRAIAVHESGHAVAAWALFLPVERLWIDGGGGTSAGRASTIVDQIAVYWAGHKATILLGIDAPKELAACDKTKVGELVSSLSSDEASRTVEAGGSRARELLSPNLEMLKVVAQELDRVGAMDPVRFLEIAARCGNRQGLAPT